MDPSTNGRLENLSCFFCGSHYASFQYIGMKNDKNVYLEAPPSFFFSPNAFRQIFLYVWIFFVRDVFFRPKPFVPFDDQKDFDATTSTHTPPQRINNFRVVSSVLWVFSSVLWVFLSELLFSKKPNSSHMMYEKNAIQCCNSGGN